MAASIGIDGFTKRGDIKLTNGWIVAKEFGHFTHGYVTTSYASQGKTVDHVMLAESEISFPAASNEQFYVSASRGRKKATVYTDSKAGLLDGVQRADDSLSATELSQLAKRTRRDRTQQLINLDHYEYSIAGGIAHA